MEFQKESVAFLLHTHFPRLKRAVETLPPGDLWWRPHEGANSVANLLLLLAGNVRQWIVSGLGGAPDHRLRAEEFSARSGDGPARLLAHLESAVKEACAVIERMDDAALRRSYEIQGFPCSGVHAVLHVVEHFAWHTGQIVWIAKWRAGPGHGIAFNDDSKLNTARNR
jgi:uncharacterized damage-inducible protein DinB